MASSIEDDERRQERPRRRRERDRLGRERETDEERQARLVNKKHDSERNEVKPDFVFHNCDRICKKGLPHTFTFLTITWRSSKIQA